MGGAVLAIVLVVGTLMWGLFALRAFLNKPQHRNPGPPGVRPKAPPPPPRPQNMKPPRKPEKFYREKYPAVQEAWEQYVITLKLVGGIPDEDAPKVGTRTMSR